MLLASPQGVYMYTVFFISFDPVFSQCHHRVFTLFFIFYPVPGSAQRVCALFV